MRPLLLSFITILPVALCQYVLTDDYTSGVFADEFNFFTGNDPTNGYVNYLSQADAVSSGLLRTYNDGSVYMGVDDTNVATGRGRNSIRIESKKTYNHGLFILDLAHMPGGQCGTWPAYWLKGPQAPAYSELDIIEGINLDSTSLMSVKTNQACSISQQPMTGTLKTTDCNINTGGIVGCSINSASPATYGTGFNNLGGGVYATEWTSNAITIWYFARNAIPADITAGTPNPQLWGVPLAKFAPNCRLDDNFVNQNIVMNIDFCGDYAADPFFYNQNPTCTSQAASCNDFVKNNPGAFTETYWRINQLKVYQFSTGSSTSSSTSSPSPVPQSTTSGLSSSMSTTSQSLAITTSSSYIASTGSVVQPPSSNILPIGGSTTSSTGYNVFTSGLPPSSSSNILPIDGSTTTSAGYNVLTSSLPPPSSSSVQPAQGSTTTSSFFVYTGLPPQPTSSSSTTTSSFFVYTGLPPQPTSSSSSTTSLLSPSSLSSSGSSTTAPLYSSVGPIGGSTTNTIPQSTNGPLLGSTSTSSLQSLTSSSSFAVNPNLGSTTSSTSGISVAQSSTSASPYSGTTSPTSLSRNSSKAATSSSQTTKRSGQAGNGGWGGQVISSTVITTTLKGTWVEPCPTGLTTKTTTLVTTHCGCTREPLPTFSLTTTTITCPAGWPITTPFVVVKPVRPQPTGHEVIVTTEPGGKIITITRPVITPTQTVILPVTVVPLPPMAPNGLGSAGAPPGTLVTKTGSLVNSNYGYGPVGSSSPTPPANAPAAFPHAPGVTDPGSGVSPGGSDSSGYQVNGDGSSVTNEPSNGHQNEASGSGGSSPASNNGGSSYNGESYGSNDPGAPAPSSSSWISTYTGAAATVVASSTLLLSLAIVAFIFLELSVV
ncbi:hypothetical protein LTR84_009602 [Exophiala bonariae]|uniref:endo-1,3(4)-beta-glucanase n=1 Tax=Exophiala bonariae TaxID=1690606 RepID=A0AAV9NJW4_9EURO|nr:hypothetical protein LTR84_009602 [Exophiala bonariae]